MKISAIVPVWNGWKHLEKLLRTVETQTLPISEMVVVDNGSSDGVADLAEYWGARVIRFSTNRGFAAAVNRGVEASQGDLLAVINSDVELSPDWAELLANSIAERGVWFATGLILSAHRRDRIDGAWDLVSKAGMPWRAGNGAGASESVFQTDRTISMAPLTAVLLRRDLWNKVGALDERFESYLEDVDFGLRCIAGGYGGFYNSRAICHHEGSATLGRWNSDSVRRMSRNQVFLVRKHFTVQIQRHWWWNLLVGQALWGIVAARHGAGFAWLRGKYDAAQRWREFAPTQTAGLETFLEASDREIFELQEQMGFDRYWRWYRALTRPKLWRNDTGTLHE